MQFSAATTKRSQQSSRETFDDISLRTFSFLDAHDGVTDLVFHERAALTFVELDAWERDHAPLTLPNDLKNFFLLSNGLLATWSILFKDATLPLGAIHINALENMVPIDMTRQKLRKDISTNEDSDSEDLPVDEEHSYVSHSLSKVDYSKPCAFDLDNKCGNGRVALVYEHGHSSKPAIYFQDLACDWYLMARSFTDYFRSLMLHLGLPDWQYIYTSVGLSPYTEQWLRFLSPERLEIDLKSRRRALSSKREKRKKKNSSIYSLTRSTETKKKEVATFDMDRIDKMAAALARKRRQELTGQVPRSRERPSSSTSSLSVRPLRSSRPVTASSSSSRVKSSARSVKNDSSSTRLFTKRPNLSSVTPRVNTGRVKGSSRPRTASNTRTSTRTPSNYTSTSRQRGDASDFSKIKLNTTKAQNLYASRRTSRN